MRNSYAYPRGIHGLGKQGRRFEVLKRLPNLVECKGCHGVLERHGLPLVAACVHVRQIIGDGIHTVLGGQRGKKSAKHACLHKQLLVLAAAPKKYAAVYPEPDGSCQSFLQYAGQ